MAQVIIAETASVGVCPGEKRKQTRSAAAEEPKAGHKPRGLWLVIWLKDVCLRFFLYLCHYHYLVPMPLPLPLL